MQLTSGAHLTYCMNVHPGETWDDLLYSVRTYLPAVKSRLSPSGQMGVGLRLSGQACESSIGREHELKEALESVGTYAFTVNAFPHGAFHDTRVKESVYQPDWSDPERLKYTLRAAELLAELLPEQMEGSVSTVPLGYKDGRVETGDGRRIVHKHLLHTAKGLERIYDTTGKRIHVGLEPEPDCQLETTDETVAFLKGLFQHPEGDLLRTYIGVCMDTCHVALQFEDPAAALSRYQAEGIRISKIQLSAALEADAMTVPSSDLEAFDDGVYFHQTISSSGRRWRDLPEWLSSPDRKAGRLRIHCHVPLDWKGADTLRSTRHTLTPAFWQEVTALGNPHLEVETYTFEVLPAHVRRKKNVEHSIADECQWVLDRISDLNLTKL